MCYHMKQMNTVIVKTLFEDRLKKKRSVSNSLKILKYVKKCESYIETDLFLRRANISHVHTKRHCDVSYTKRILVVQLQ